jgi:hypothetical protein
MFAGENTEFFVLFSGAALNRELQLIAFNYVLFRLDGELPFLFVQKR